VARCGAVRGMMEGWTPPTTGGATSCGRDGSGFGDRCEINCHAAARRWRDGGGRRRRTAAARARVGGRLGGGARRRSA
jgi:hypothetical protein